VYGYCYRLTLNFDCFLIKFDSNSKVREPRTMELRLRVSLFASVGYFAETVVWSSLKF